MRLHRPLVFFGAPAFGWLGRQPHPTHSAARSRAAPFILLRFGSRVRDALHRLFSFKALQTMSSARLVRTAAQMPFIFVRT